jgi:ESS family glutamate:Na+ symporter
VKLDFIQTVAFAGLVLFAGYGIKRLVPLLARYNIPAPVAGGLPVAALLAFAAARSWQPLAFDTMLQVPLQNTFFASVGFGGSVLLLKRGGLPLLIMMILASVAALMQNVIGGATAAALGQHPLMGVLAGSVTLTGGPATGLAFAPQFEAAGVRGAATLAVSAAMIGIVAGGILGGPIGTWLIGRGARMTSPPVGASGGDAVAAAGGSRAVASAEAGTLENIAERQFAEPVVVTPAGEDVEAYSLMKHFIVMLVAVGAGVWVSAWMTAHDITLPAYIGAMTVALVIRNVDDLTGVVGLSQRTIDDIGTVALSIFLVMALMTLRLGEIVGVIGPLLVILAVQVAFIALLCLFVVPRLMGNDYDAAVMSGGFCGFMLGTTANAVANMSALVERYGPAPRAYLVVPLVGAFGIDIVNGYLITWIVNLNLNL